MHFFLMQRMQRSPNRPYDLGFIRDVELSREKLLQSFDDTGVFRNTAGCREGLLIPQNQKFVEIGE